MELRLYLEIVKRRAMVILIVVAMAVLVVASAGFFLPAIYTARTTVRILLDVGVSDFILREDYNTRLLNTYAAVLQSEPILEEAAARQTPPVEAEALAGRVSVQVMPDTELITISVMHHHPGVAQNLANTLATLLVEYAQDLYVGGSKSTREIVEEQLASMANDLEQERQALTTLVSAQSSTAEIEALNRQIEFKEDAYDRLLDRYELARLNESLRANSVTIIAPAKLPQVPANRLGLRQIVLGLVVGLLGGAGLALALENLDTQLHSAQQVERLFNVPVLGSVPRGLLAADDLQHDGALGNNKRIEEAYRLLCINLLGCREELLEREQVPMQSILVTSATAHEGKSMVAANLARIFADQGRSVFMVESDLRHPTVAEKMGVDNDMGLSSLLLDRLPLNDATLGQLICATDQPSLFVVSSGPRIPNPTALFASPYMAKLVDYLGAQGQVTLLDAPPVLGVADVSVLAPKVDGIVFVVRQAYSSRESVGQALKQLKAARARVLGVVFCQKSSRPWGY
ncbi:MAG TPA: polysaccharide biosynthesis tyrosine autokinase [Anaerolineae bacterium]|nr:polysaccharide biosynthesis tyrosine autokinase [Anaerolineae bacterium]